jgi:hypothetical protein
MQRLVRVDERDDPTKQRALVLAQRRKHRVQLAAEDLARQVRVLELAPRVRVGGGGSATNDTSFSTAGLVFRLRDFFCLFFFQIASGRVVADVGREDTRQGA